MTLDGRLIEANRALLTLLGPPHADLLTRDAAGARPPGRPRRPGRLPGPDRGRRAVRLQRRAALPAPGRRAGAGARERVDRCRDEDGQAAARDRPGRGHHRAQGGRARARSQAARAGRARARRRRSRRRSGKLQARHRRGARPPGLRRAGGRTAAAGRARRSTPTPPGSSCSTTDARDAGDGSRRARCSRRTGQVERGDRIPMPQDVARRIAGTDEPVGDRRRRRPDVLHPLLRETGHRVAGRGAARGRGRLHGALQVGSPKQRASSRARTGVAAQPARRPRGARRAARAAVRARARDRRDAPAQPSAPSLPLVPGFTWRRATCRPAPTRDVGGDWYDVILLEDGRIGDRDRRRRRATASGPRR